jgi:hypothetical protein
MKRLIRCGCVTAAAALLASALADVPAAQSRYLTPPKTIVDILDAAPLPGVVVSPSRSAMALLERNSMPSIAEVAEPMLRLAGMRISPRTNGLHRPGGSKGLKFRRPDGEKVVALLAGALIQDTARRQVIRVTLVQKTIGLWVAEVSSDAHVR